MGGRAILSKDGKGRTRLDCTIGGKAASFLWEPVGSGYLETLFNGNGHILRQELCPDADRSIDDALREFGPASSAEFHEVEIDKSCPSCNNPALSRHCESFASSGSVPVMPVYHCGSCKAKSYYLTDEYLEYLVEKKRDLFESSELESMAGNREQFLTELRAYVIRIFASKRIMTIK